MLGFKSIWLKLAGAMAAISGVLFMLLKSEKSKRKAAELEAKTEKGNREHLEKERDIISDIEEGREKWNEKHSEEAINQSQKLEGLAGDKENLTDREFANQLAGLHSKNNRKD